MLGQTFKEEISDIRNSPAIRVAEILVKKGATISYSDYNIPEVEIHGEILHSVELTSAALRRFDAAIVLVAHSKFDLAFVADNSKLLIDTKNATAGLRQRLNVAKV
jgi:UDP-N-acetyl-D-glucosamine dehydrogenase